MTTRRWQNTHKRPTAAEQRVKAREKALENCLHGSHMATPTFRPGETVCTTCGMVLYCPDCLNENHLQPPLVHAYPVICTPHKNAEVQV